MDNTKPWWQSTAIVGALVPLIVWGIKTVFKVDVGPADIQPIIDNALLIAGTVLGIIGRVRATKTIGTPEAPK